MFFVGCSIPEQYVNPLFEVFDGGDFVLSSYRDIEEPLTRMRIYFVESGDTDAARQCLAGALDIIGVKTEIERGEMADQDWKFAYRRHFKTEPVGRRLLIVPTWELDGLDPKLAAGRENVTLDPGMAFGTGKHETTRACLEYIDELSSVGGSMLDMGCGSGILSIAAAKLGYSPVEGFDVDQEAVEASLENGELNRVAVRYRKFALGRPNNPKGDVERRDLVVANILGPLLIRFADEIASYCRRHLVISGILTELYPEVLAAYESRGFVEVSRKTLGEWTTGLLIASAARI